MRLYRFQQIVEVDRLMDEFIGGTFFRHNEGVQVHNGAHENYRDIFIHALYFKHQFEAVHERHSVV
jgi:hypothetical protein